jgi:hypothetical protein
MSRPSPQASRPSSRHCVARHLAARVAHRTRLPGGGLLGSARLVLVYTLSGAASLSASPLPALAIPAPTAAAATAATPSGTPARPFTPASSRTPAHPDIESATLRGTVRTQAGNRLEGATVRFAPEPAGQPLATRTDPRGEFQLGIPAGTPGTLTVEGEGMVTATLPIRALAADEVRSVALTLVPLYQLDAITVVRGRDRPLLNTEDAAQGGALEASEIQALPTDARNPLTLAFTVPGVSQATAFFGDAPPLTISGDNALYTGYVIDGLDNKEGFLGGPRVLLPLAALARLEVFTATYRPGLGRSPNGVVSMETRAGGPVWEGELLLAGRPGTPLDASPKFAPPGVDPDGFRRFQFGGALGGPLVADQTFLFVALEGTDEREDRIGSTAQADFLGTELRTTWRGFARIDHGWSPRQTTTLRLALSDVERVGQGGGVIVPEADITTVRRGSLSSLTHRSTLRGGEAANTPVAPVGHLSLGFSAVGERSDHPPGHDREPRSDHGRSGGGLIQLHLRRARAASPASQRFRGAAGRLAHPPGGSGRATQPLRTSGRQHQPDGRLHGRQ